MDRDIPAVVFGLPSGPNPLIAIVLPYLVISFVEGNVMVPAIEAARSLSGQPSSRPPSPSA